MATHPGDPDDRRFTDREMKLIFERAGEADVSTSGDQGHTLAELQEIALQVGLNPDDVARAASTVSAPQTSNALLGAPVRFHASRTLDTKLTDDDIVSVALKIREATGFHGELRVVPGGSEWRVRTPAGLIVVDFTARGNRTRIDVMIARGDQAFLTVVGAGLASLVAGWLVTGIGIIAFDIPPLAAIGIGGIAAIGSAWAGARLLWTRVARGWEAKTNALMKVIRDAAERSSGDSYGT